MKVTVVLAAVVVGALVFWKGKQIKTGSNCEKERFTGNVLQKVSFWEHGDMAPVVDKMVLIRKEDGTLVQFYISEETSYEYLEGPELMNQVQELFETYEVGSWDGFQEDDKTVLDGVSFGLDLVFTDGKKLSAQGNNAFPKNYQQVSKGLKDLTAPALEQMQSQLEQSE